jgi:hypothetical protein
MCLTSPSLAVIKSSLRNVNWPPPNPRTSLGAQHMQPPTPSTTSTTSTYTTSSSCC